MSNSNAQITGYMLIYSGRRDPQWAMSEGDWNELTQLIETLSLKAEEQGVFTEPSYLGYRGFVSRRGKEQIYYTERDKQAVKVTNNSFVVYNDPTKSVETWFIQNAKKNENLDLRIPEY